MVQAGNDKSSDISLSSMNNGFRFLEAGVSGCVENLANLSNDVQAFKEQNMMYRQMGDLIDVYAVFEQIETIARFCTDCSLTEKDSDNVLYAIKALANIGFIELQKAEAANQNISAE